LQNQINSLSLWYKIKDIMKKSVVVGLFIGLVGVLCSFNSPETFVKSSGVPVSVSDTLVDSTLYNSYMVHYKKGYTQVLQYPSTWDVRDMLGRKVYRKVVKIDTLQLNVFESQLN
jgi:hypothetical protein